jgi:solute carrier family 7 (L-type amino acid transporter), member 9/15
MASESGETRPLLADQQESGNEHVPSRDPDGVARVDNYEVEAQSGSFSRNLGTAEAFAIVISIVIGSGIFTSPGSIDTNVPSPGAALVIWLVGGLLAWTGASTMAELGTAIPGEGEKSARSFAVSSVQVNQRLPGDSRLTSNLARLLF